MSAHLACGPCACLSYVIAQPLTHVPVPVMYDYTYVTPAHVSVMYGHMVHAPSLAYVI